MTRRIPYLFLVDRPGARGAPVLPLARTSRATRAPATTASRPTAIPPRRSATSPDAAADARERRRDGLRDALDRPAVNIGVSVLDADARRARSTRWYLGAQDENTVQGYAGTPVDVNGLTYDYLAPVGAAGASFPRQGRFYVAVDSGRDPFTGRSLAGTLRPALVGERRDAAVAQLLTTRVSAGTADARLPDDRHAVRRRPASLDDRIQGRARRRRLRTTARPGSRCSRCPRARRRCPPGRPRATTMISSDFQEAKNIDTIGPSIMPNTRARDGAAARRRRRRRSTGCRRLRARARRRSSGSSSRRARTADRLRSLRRRRHAGRDRPRRSEQGLWKATSPPASPAERTRSRRPPSTRSGESASATADGPRVQRVASSPGRRPASAPRWRGARARAAGTACCSHGARSDCSRWPRSSAASTRSATSPTARPSTDGGRVLERHPAIALLVNNAGVAGARGLPRRAIPRWSRGCCGRTISAACGASGHSCRASRRRRRRTWSTSSRSRAPSPCRRRGRMPRRSTRSSRFPARPPPSSARGGSACTRSSPASSRPRASRRPGCRPSCGGSSSHPGRSQRTSSSPWSAAAASPRCRAGTAWRPSCSPSRRICSPRACTSEARH